MKLIFNIHKQYVSNEDGVCSIYLIFTGKNLLSFQKNSVTLLSMCSNYLKCVLRQCYTVSSKVKLIYFNEVHNKIFLIENVYVIFIVLLWDNIIDTLLCFTLFISNNCRESFFTCYRFSNLIKFQYVMCCVLILKIMYRAAKKKKSNTFSSMCSNEKKKGIFNFVTYFFPLNQTVVCYVVE